MSYICKLKPSQVDLTGLYFKSRLFVSLDCKYWSRCSLTNSKCFIVQAPWPSLHEIKSMVLNLNSSSYSLR